MPFCTSFLFLSSLSPRDFYMFRLHLFFFLVVCTLPFYNNYYHFVKDHRDRADMQLIFQMSRKITISKSLLHLFAELTKENAIVHLPGEISPYPLRDNEIHLGSCAFPVFFNRPYIPEHFSKPLMIFQRKSVYLSRLTGFVIWCSTCDRLDNQKNRRIWHLSP